MEKLNFEKHYINRSNWLRAAVLGANDGILSTTSLAIGVAAADPVRDSILLATIAGIVAGAMAMAAGEFVSVSSQADVTKADLEREKSELERMPEQELKELAMIYEQRGLTTELSLEVARQLTAHDAIGAHARDELGINEMTTPKPFQAAVASAFSFTFGGLLPLIIALSAPLEKMIYYQYGFAVLFLAISGTVAAMIGGSSIRKAVVRICIWGTVAMIISALVGHWFGVEVG